MLTFSLYYPDIYLFVCFTETISPFNRISIVFSFTLYPAYSVVSRVTELNAALYFVTRTRK